MFPLQYISDAESTISLLRFIPWLWGWFMMIVRAITNCWRDWDLLRSMPLLAIAVDRASLEQSPPKLVVTFNFLNCSLYDIQMRGIGGRVRFAGRDISGTMEAAASSEVVNRLASVGVSVTAWLSNLEAQEILEASQQQHHIQIGISGLHIYASVYRPVMGGKKRSLSLPQSFQVRTDGRWRVEKIVEDLIQARRCD